MSDRVASCPLPLLVSAPELEEALAEGASASGERPIAVVYVGDIGHYRREHIPGARHLDYAELISPAPPAMGLMPSPEAMAEVLGGLGITRDTHVVAYDAEGGGKASRLLWTLDVLGHDCFSLLDGGWQAWCAAGCRAREGGESVERASYWIDQDRPEASVDKEWMLRHYRDPEVVVVDARSREEFDGVDLRARRGGHIPGAVHLDWRSLMDPEQAPRLLDAPRMRELLEHHGISPDREVVVHCQTHHRSSLTYVALRALGYNRVRAYAGSWSEWGNDPETPVAS